MDASIIYLYKRKGNHQVCDNHRGISLLSIAGKIQAKVNSLNVHLDQVGFIPEVWAQERQMNNRHGFYSKTNSK